jgi:hypothetical protein
MFNLNTFSAFAVITMCSFSSIAQPLTNGMGIITHWSGAASTYDSFTIYDTENNARRERDSNPRTNNKRDIIFT